MVDAFDSFKAILQIGVLEDKLLKKQLELEDANKKRNTLETILKKQMRQLSASDLQAGTARKFCFNNNSNIRKKSERNRCSFIRRTK